jgi:5-methylcytosine-specific restriction endonuclease McrA
MLRVCVSCSGLYTRPSSGDVGRCTDCAESYRRSQPTTAQKGLGSKWQRLAREQVRNYPSCWYCGATTDLTVDHIKPRALGGTVADGLRTACRPCNSRRGARPHVG